MLTAVPSSSQTRTGGETFRGDLVDLHPGFHDRSSIMLHRRAIDPEVQERLTRIATFDVVQTHDEVKVLRKGRRNAPALFGAGQIDAIPDRILREAEQRSFPNFPEIKGRVSALPDGRLGRFGWRVKLRASTTSCGQPARTSLAWRCRVITRRASRQPTPTNHPRSCSTWMRNNAGP
jgi:hypothetical protein